MRLLNVRTRKLEEFPDESQAPDYGILSHTWADGEVLFADIEAGDHAHAQQKRGYDKIDFVCEQANCHDPPLTHAWIDTCCIDKRSSAELSEAINSMFRWYQCSRVCWVYLTDTLPRSIDQNGWTTMSVANEDWSLADYRWFSRGWTLQELLAPQRVEFYDRKWHCRGDLPDLKSVVSQITGISADVLMKRIPISSTSVAKRMSWAAKRKTTRIEDRAYSLLGIFDINMPM